jgi:SAM-dependent methyltransferase
MNRDQLHQIVSRYARGELSGPVAVMHLLLATEDVEEASRALADLSGPATAIDDLSTLLASNAAGCRTITEMLRAGLDSHEPAATVEAGIAATRALFDDSVARCETASVALYSLGSEPLLAAATAEVIRVLDSWGVLGSEREALEVGCGIGRLLRPLALRLRNVVGIDISDGMVAAARRRNAEVANVQVRSTHGRDLGDFSDSSFDLVLVVDAFPYIVRSGRQLARAMFAEVRRVLRPRGDLVICNYSYGQDRAADAREVTSSSDEVGLTVVRSDEAPFRLWDAIAYQLRAPG